MEGLRCKLYGTAHKWQSWVFCPGDVSPRGACHVWCLWVEPWPSVPRPHNCCRAQTMTPQAHLYLYDVRQVIHILIIQNSV